MSTDPKLPLNAPIETRSTSLALCASFAHGLAMRVALAESQETGMSQRRSIADQNAMRLFSGAWDRTKQRSANAQGQHDRHCKIRSSGLADAAQTPMPC